MIPDTSYSTSKQENQYVSNDQTKELLDYEREMQLRLEKIAKDNQIKKTILKKVESMTIHDFQNAVDESGISGNTVIDEMVENLVDYLFEQRST